MAHPLRYLAFISYSHHDKACADWLHRALETFRVPTKLVGKETAYGTVPKRLVPVFRDRAELPASDDLGSAIEAALQNSGHLIVICSPAAARSKWVDKEVRTFKRLHGEQRVLALIASGEPYAGDCHAAMDEECFPPSLKLRFDAGGHALDVPAEPIAADIRPGKDGRRLALLKLVAGLTGVGLDDLAQRDAQRRMRQMAVIATASVAGMIVTSGLAIYANQQRLEADRQRSAAQVQRGIAERESAAATSAADFLIGTFALSNPATENPRTITALTILDRGADRARTELANQPALQARLVATLGGAYAALGLLQEAEKVVLSSRQAVDRAGPDGVYAILRLADIYRLRGDTSRAIALVRDAERRLREAPLPSARLQGMAASIEGRAYAARLDVKRSVAAFDRAIVAFQRARDRKPGEIVAPLREKGAVLSDDGQFARSSEALALALTFARSELGDVHLITGSVELGLAQNAFQQGNLELAAKWLAPALAIFRKVLDPGAPILADALLMQGQIELGQKRYAAASQSLSQAAAIYRNAFGQTHFMIGIADVYLALAKSGRGDLKGSLAAFEAAKAQYDASYGELHANHGDLLVNRATVLAKFGRGLEAEADCAEGLRILGKTLGADAGYTRTMADTCAKL